MLRRPGVRADEARRATEGERHIAHRREHDALCALANHEALGIAFTLDAAGHAA
jgi:hypothetical protein